MGVNVLLVCEGNICRSPAAEYLLRLHTSAPLACRSAGLATRPGRPAHPRIAELLAERGLDLSGHRSRPLTAAELRGHDLVLVMESWHQRRLLECWPEMRGRVALIAPAGIPDPWGGPDALFVDTVRRLEAATVEWGERIGCLA